MLEQHLCFGTRPHIIRTAAGPSRKRIDDMHDTGRPSAVSESATAPEDDRDTRNLGRAEEFNGERPTPEVQRVSENMFGSIVDRIPILLVLTDSAGRVISVNREFERLTSWTSQELVGTDPWSALFPEESVHAGAREFFGGDQTGWQECSLTTRCGASVDTCWAKVRLENGCSVCLAIDLRTWQEWVSCVAERNRALQLRADQLRTMAVELTEAEQKERKELAQVLHDDLQQLLVGAKFRIFALKAQSTDPCMDGSLDEVHSLITESIEVCRSLSHRLSPDVLCQAGLAPALEWLARYFCETHRLEVVLDIDPAVNPPAEAIRHVLFHSARELLLNVAKHAQTNRARVRLIGRDQFIDMIVTDAGCGFDPSAVRLAGGTGLVGIEERARLLGGTLSVASEPGLGSRFTMTLPSGTRPAETEQEAAGTRQHLAADKNRNKRRNIRLILVDDHNIVRQGLTLLLSQQTGFEVVGEAGNGQEAVELARLLQPDVVLMDVSMPVMDGVEATKIIKSENPRIEVIGLSTFSETAVHKKMIEAGASGYVSKGGPSEVLADVIRQVCGRGC